MIKLKAGTQYVIIVAIFLFSVYIGLKSSNVLEKTKVKTIDTKYSEKLFSESNNYEKIRTVFRTDNLNDKLKEISAIIDKEDINIVYSIKKNNNYIGIYEIDSKNMSIISALQNVDELESESIEKNNNFEEAINIEGNLNNYLMSKKTIQNQLLSSALSTASKSSLRKDLSIIQVKIDSLLYLPKLIEKSKKNKLLYVSIIHKNNSGAINSMKIVKFTKVTLSLLVVLTLGLIVLYYTIMLTTFLMKKMGVKTARSSSSNYNYNNYYSRGKKKVKRIYKEEPKEESDKK